MPRLSAALWRRWALQQVEMSGNMWKPGMWIGGGKVLETRDNKKCHHYWHRPQTGETEGVAGYCELAHVARD